MKKPSFLSVFVLSSIFICAQTARFEAISTKLPGFELLMEPPPKTSSLLTNQDNYYEQQKSEKNVNATFVQLGSAANAFSTAFNGRTYLWADPVLNSVVFTHRMTGGTEVEGNSRIAYDLSTDGGYSWIVDNRVFIPTGPDPGTGWPLNSGRYPQGLIINPVGNTNPDNAYYEYFSASLNGENNSWGGYVFGSNELTKIPPEATQNALTSGGDIWRVIPNAHHVTQLGVAWTVAESSKYDGLEYYYTGNLIMDRGEIVDGEIVYTEALYEFLEEGENFNDIKMAFAPDGLTGFIVAMTENLSDPVENTNYHPVLLKTTDGGETWSDSINVQLGGLYGIESVKNYLPDSIITLLDFYSDWDGNRNDLIFNMGFHVDIVVDKFGNPHLIGLISLGTTDGDWYPGLGTEWALYSEDGGESWDADPLWDQYWFDGNVGDFPVYNRPQASIDSTGRYIFYSWLDTEADQAEENNRPNIYFIYHKINNEGYSDIDNLTYFTQAWDKAFLGSQSYYVFTTNPSFEYFDIPFTYIEFEIPDDPLSAITYWYFTHSIIGDDIEDQYLLPANFKIEQNFPNPATGHTKIMVTAKTEIPVELRVSNILGQVVYKDRIKSCIHSHSFTVDVSGFDPGIYLYTVNIGNQSITKKMMVR